MIIADLVRENIKKLKPFSSAREEYSGEAKALLDANESPFETGYNRYPDPHQKILKGHIASKYSIGEDQIILGNGSDEIIDLAVRTFCVPGVDIIRYITPSFGMYEVVADINDVHKEAILLDEDFDIHVEACLKDQTQRHKLLFLCSPNNPTGNLLSEQRIVEVINGWRGIVVLDEAYIEFTERKSLICRLEDFPNLLIIQTFSKAMGGAGLRLGMGFASVGIIGYLNKIKPPYNVNLHTQKFAQQILKEKETTSRHIEAILNEKSKICNELSKISSVLHVFPSDTNFLLVKCKDHLRLYDHLIQAGVIVRDRSKLPGCQSCLRITIGLPEENGLMIDSMKKFYG